MKLSLKQLMYLRRVSRTGQGTTKYKSGQVRIIKLASLSEMVRRYARF